MSAYQYPAAAPSYPAAAADPTAVIGRRIGAWVIDALLFLLVLSFLGPTPLSPLAEYFEVPDSVDDPCAVLQDDDEDIIGCTYIGDRVYVTETGDALVQTVAVLAVVLGYAALQGATGVTPGKAAFGVKVVDAQGARPGFGRSLLRTVLWAIDGLPCVPLVGLITGLTTTGHRRVGDMAASTFVVGKAHSGPVQVPGMTAPAVGGYPPPGAYGAGPQQPWGAPPASPSPTWGSAPSPGTPPPTGPAPSSGAPAPSPGGYPPPGSHPAPGSPTASGEHRPAPPGGATPGAPASDTPPPGERVAAPGSPGESPPGTPDTAGRAMPGPAAEQQASAPGPTTPGPTGTGQTGAGEAAPGQTPSGPTAAGPAPQATARPGQPATPPGGAAPSPGQQPPTAAPTAGTGPTPGAGQAGQAGQAGSGYNPQWDAARGTYIVWEPTRRRWLGWDEAAQEWKPL